MLQSFKVLCGMQGKIQEEIITAMQEELQQHAGATLRILLRLQLHPQRGILHPQSLVCTPNVFFYCSRMAIAKLIFPLQKQSINVGSKSKAMAKWTA